MTDTTTSKDFKENGVELKQAIKDIKKDYDLVYFVPNSNNIANIDTDKCMAVSEYDNLSTVAMKPIDNHLHTEESCRLNVGMVQSSKSWKDYMEKKPKINYVSGMNYKVVQGYFADNTKHFDTAKVLSSGIAKSFKDVTTSTNGYITKPHGNQHQYSVEWTGTFKAAGSGRWSFWTVSDDASYMWIGKNAIKNYVPGNANINNGGLHGMRWKRDDIQLERGKTYPLRIQFGENWGGHNVHVHVHGPDSNGRYRHWSMEQLVTNEFNQQDNTLYYSLVESTPELSRQGLYNCYIADTSNSLNTELSSDKNAFNYKVVWSAFDESSEASKIKPTNYAYYRNGALFVCEKNGKVLKQIGDTIDQDQFNYSLTGTEVVHYLYRYPDLMRGAGGWSNYRNWNNYARKHWIEAGSREKRTFEQRYTRQNLKLDNNGNILARGKALVSVDSKGAIENPQWKAERNVLNRPDFLYPHDPYTWRPTTKWNMQGGVIRRTAWDNQTLLISENGKFKLEISENGNLVIKTSISGCTGKTEGGTKYTTLKDNQRGENYYLYKTDADIKMDKMFVGQVTNNKRVLKPVNVVGNDITMGNNFIKYDDYAPSNTEGGFTVSTHSECQAKCITDNSCDHYYSYVTEDGKMNCKTGSQPGIKQFVPIQPGSGIKSSELYIRDSEMNLPDNDIRKMIPRKNTSNYQSYSTYEVTPALYELGDGNIMQDSYNKPRTLQDKIVNGTKNKVETFDNHGYQSSKEVNDKYGEKPTEKGLSKAIQEHQIAPMKHIENDYNELLEKINVEYNGINSTLNDITNANQTGLRDQLMNDPDTGYLDTDYDTEVLKKKAVDVRIDDINDMIDQTNTVYTLGTVTAMTLLIAGIFISRD